jgi:hypothetical protein
VPGSGSSFIAASCRVFLLLIIRCHAFRVPCRSLCVVAPPWGHGKRIQYGFDKTRSDRPLLAPPVCHTVTVEKRQRPVAVTGMPPAPWVAALVPSPDWTISTTAEEAGWQIEARWWGFADDPPGPLAGPREVVIRATTPDGLRRGVTSGVMRRMERLLGELTTDVTSHPRGGRDADQGPTYEEILAARVAALPEGGPRSAPGDYYGALLDLFEEVAVTDPQPVNTLAAVMGVPRGTLNTRLATARRLRSRETARQRQADTGGGDSPRKFGLRK